LWVRLPPSALLQPALFGEFVAASSTNVMVVEPSHDVGALNGAGLVDVFASS
jgi:hypothetical protein